MTDANAPPAAAAAGGDALLLLLLLLCSNSCLPPNPYPARDRSHRCPLKAPYHALPPPLPPPLTPLFSSPFLFILPLSHLLQLPSFSLVSPMTPPLPLLLPPPPFRLKPSPSPPRFPQLPSRAVGEGEAGKRPGYRRGPANRWTDEEPRQGAESRRGAEGWPSASMNATANLLSTEKAAEAETVDDDYDAPPTNRYHSQTRPTDITAAIYGTILPRSRPVCTLASLPLSVCMSSTVSLSTCSLFCTTK